MLGGPTGEVTAVQSDLTPAVPRPRPRVGSGDQQSGLTELQAAVCLAVISGLVDPVRPCPCPSQAFTGEKNAFHAADVI